MDDQTDRLSDLERRLAGLAPAADGLNADAVLFAAGRASAVRTQGALAVLNGLLLLIVAGLGIGLVNKHREQQVLAELVRQLQVQPAPPAGPGPPVESAPAELPGATSLVASHRVLERGLDSWNEAQAAVAPAASVQDEPVLRVRSGTDWLER